MRRSFFKPIIGGVILGSVLFFAGPALFVFLFVVLTLKFIFTPFGMGRRMMMHQMYRPHWGSMSGWMNADNIRNMSDEEYTNFKNRMQQYSYSYSGCCGHRSQNPTVTNTTTNNSPS